ncbi:hypothetical protein TNCT_264241 [Trichonephila clavata]|uniref:Uncharacterized protein n=1 Tax=Trichonephila clavata TaxID=2740835 RepID=A0A8X6L5Z3_TRICU|nr:hypothetical protein TNCT_264241 [Trichonephila clavata]
MSCPPMALAKPSPRPRLRRGRLPWESPSRGPPNSHDRCTRRRGSVKRPSMIVRKRFVVINFGYLIGQLKLFL